MNDVPFFRLAVQQAETKFGFMATYPVFLEWMEDPVFTLERRRDEGMRIYYLILACSFLWQLLMVGGFTWRFSKLGRVN